MKPKRGFRDLNNEIKVLRGGVLPIGATPISTGNRRNGPGNIEPNELEQLESRLEDYTIFLHRLAKDVEDWVITTRHSVESLQQWGTTFGAVLGLAPSSSAPYPLAYKAFTSLSSSLLGLCRKLEDDLQTSFNPLLRKLKVMTEHPQWLLSEMHSLELPPSLLARFRRSDKANKHRRYLFLKSTLLAQLPVLLHAMDRAIELAVRIMTQKRVIFLKAVREKWTHLFSSLREEGEHCGGTEETLKAWQVRWEVGRQMLLNWEKRYILGDSSAVQEIGPATWSEMTLPVQLSVTSAGLPSVNDAPSFSQATPPKFPMFSHPSSSPSSSWTYLSATDAVSVLYTIRALRSYSPPPHNPYQGHSFFKLVNGDSFDVLQEYDHPSRHTDLPRCFVNEKGEDCLLKVRARNSGVRFEAGDMGWVLARFVCPAD